MPIFDGYEGREKFKVCSIDSEPVCLEYLSEKGARDTAIEEAKKTGKDHVVTYILGTEEKIIGIAKPDGTFIEKSTEESESKPEQD
jgi:hypothetical protein